MTTVTRPKGDAREGVPPRVGPAAGPARRKKKNRLLTVEGSAPYLLVLPALGILAFFRIYPLGLGINFSFTGDQELNGVFVGLQNYFTLFADERFQASMRNVLMVMLFVPIEVLVAGLLA